MQARSIVVLFCLTAMLAAVAVAAFGWRGLLQERRLAALEQQERLDLAAEVTARKLAATVGEWAWVLDPAHFQLRASALPAALRAGVQDHPAWVLLWNERGAVVGWPEGQLLYQVSTGADWRDQGHAADEDDALRRAHARGRALRSAGDLPGALEAFHRLRNSARHLGALPAALVGHYEVCDTLLRVADPAGLAQCATEFYRALVTSQWSLAPERYAFYEAQARAWYQQSGRTAAGWHALEALGARKHVLSAAARALSDDRCQAERSQPSPELRVLATAVVLVWCRPTTGMPQPMALAMDPGWFASHLWPELSAGVSDVYHLALSGPDGRRFWATSAPPGAAAPDKRTGGAVLGDFRLHLWERDARAVHSSLVRQRWYVGALALTLVSLVVAAGSTAWALRKQLQTAQLKADFVATVSHELRTPVTAVRQMGELLLRGRVPEARRREYYERITSEAERLGRLIAQILEMARSDAGYVSYTFARVDAAAWLHAAVCSFTSRHESARSLLTTCIPASLPALHADAGAITSALHNVLENAFKYADGRSPVRVRAQEDGDSLLIEVTDEGIGMSPEEQRLAFERFYRSHRHVTGGPAGTGLGLSLVRDVVRAHGGSVDVSSRLGHGSTFSIRLPTVSSQG